VPDAIEILTQEHRQVESLFERYRNGDRSVVKEICDELTLHTAVEEKVVYPVLAAEVDGGRGLRDHAEEEHQEVKEAILGIERAGYRSPEVDGLMKKIIQGVTEHVQEEESEVFPAMRDQMSTEALERLGGRAEQAKEKLLGEVKAGGPLIDLTKDELYSMAQEKGIEGRSQMTKGELISALRSR